MEANKPCNSGLGCTLTVLFMGFSNIPDNEAEVIQNHVAEIFIITDMGGLQHFQMGVVFAGAIPFNDFMPASIAKTLLDGSFCDSQSNAGNIDSVLQT